MPSTSRPHPDGLGAELCMRHAMKDAGLSPKDIDYINTTERARPVAMQEVKAIQRIFGEDAYRLNISSTKA